MVDASVQQAGRGDVFTRTDDFLTAIAVLDRWWPELQIVTPVDDMSDI